MGRIEAAQVRKTGRYYDITNAASVRGWTAESVTVARTLPHFLKRLNRCPKNINSDCIAARCKYTIYLARESTDWDAKRGLLTEEYAPTATPNPGPRSQTRAASSNQIQ